jgi:hypothetical protein
VSDETPEYPVGATGTCEDCGLPITWTGASWKVAVHDEDQERCHHGDDSAHRPWVSA